MKTSKVLLSSITLLASFSAMAADLFPTGSTYYIPDGTSVVGFTVGTGAEGTTTKMILEGGSTFTSTSDSRLGYSPNMGGTTTFLIQGDGNTFNIAGATLYLGMGGDNKPTYTGAAEFIVTGSNNTVNIGSYVQGKTNGGSTLFSITGSNNTYQHMGFRGNFRIGWGGDSIAGSNTAYFKGDGAGASERVYINLTGTPGNLNAQVPGFEVAGAATNAVTNKATLDGNVTLRRDTDNAPVTAISINADTKTAYGTSIFEIKNSGNIVKAAALTAGNNTQVQGSSATFRVAGSGSDISVGALNIVGSAGTKSSDIRGGVLEFDFNSDDISTVNVTSVAFTGILILDFTEFTGSTGTYDLITSTSDNWSTVWTTFGWNNETQTASSDRILIKTKDGLDTTVELNYSNGTLSAVYTAVPEPSTYAAIFGALALALAIYRRRK